MKTAGQIKTTTLVFIGLIQITILLDSNEEYLWNNITLIYLKSELL